MVSDKERLRISFLTHLWDRLVVGGFTVESAPDFRMFKHGNLKFTNDDLVLHCGNLKVNVTLEHYHIRREGWHPLYWGLQCFDTATGKAKDPVHIKQLVTLLALFGRHLNEVHANGVDLTLTEPKFGWFAWTCFRFSGITSDLDNDKIYDVFADGIEAVSIRCYDELSHYLWAWAKTVKEFSVLN